MIGECLNPCSQIWVRATCWLWIHVMSDVPEVLISIQAQGILQTSHKYQCFHHPAGADTLIVTRQKEPMSHHTSIWSESESEDLTSDYLPAIREPVDTTGCSVSWTNESLPRPSLIQHHTGCAGGSDRQQNILGISEFVTSAQCDPALICEENRPSVFRFWVFFIQINLRECRLTLIHRLKHGNDKDIFLLI